MKFAFAILAWSLVVSIGGSRALAMGSSVDVVVSKIVTSGTAMPVGNGDELLTLTFRDPADPALAHRAEYVSTVGVRDAAGKYYPQSLTAVSENWQKSADGNWRIEQWIFNATLSGELTSIDHAAVLETQDGRYLGSDNLPVGKPSDPAERNRWALKLDEWVSRLTGSFNAAPLP